MKNVYIIVGFFILSLMVLTVTIYWLFVDRKIKDKKKLLAWLPPITIVVSHTILGCFCINAMVSIIVAFAIDTELMHPSAVTALFMAYAGSLLVLHTLSFCLRISIKREENDGKFSIFDGFISDFDTDSEKFEFPKKKK